MEKVYLSLGSNIGDRHGNIMAAISGLDGRICPHTALSSIVETEAWGFCGGNFLNCAVLYETGIPPHELLRICKDIERQMGRRETMEFDAEGRRIYHDRIIDIDILLYGNLTVDTPELRIPHPLMHERDFVMRPLEEIYRQDGSFSEQILNFAQH